jgi:hypothetical protein
MGMVSGKIIFYIGEFGHLVSEFVCRHVPIVLAAALKEGINI